MDMIEMMLKGELEVSDFMAIYRMDDELYEAVQALVPQEAIGNPQHEFWSGCISYSMLEAFHFDVRDMLFDRCSYGESEDDRFLIHRTIEALYTRVHPRFRGSVSPDTEFEFELDLAGSYYGGKETDPVIHEIVEQTRGMKPKSARKKEAKRRMEERFHTAGKKKPRWLQEPDWPMGEYSPMEFVSQRKTPDGAEYTFRDTDSGTERVVKQYR